MCNENTISMTDNVKIFEVKIMTICGNNINEENNDVIMACVA